MSGYYTQENSSLLFNNLSEVVHQRCDNLKLNIQLKILHAGIQLEKLPRSRRHLWSDRGALLLLCDCHSLGDHLVADCSDSAQIASFLSMMLSGIPPSRSNWSWKSASLNLSLTFFLIFRSPLTDLKGADLVRQCLARHCHVAFDFSHCTLFVDRLIGHHVFNCLLTSPAL